MCTYICIKFYSHTAGLYMVVHRYKSSICNSGHTELIFLRQLSHICGYTLYKKYINRLSLYNYCLRTAKHIILFCIPKIPTCMNFYMYMNMEQHRTYTQNSKLDIHAMHYCLAINMQRNQRNLCEAVGNTLTMSSKVLCSKTIAAGTFYAKRIEKTLKIGKLSGKIN